MSENMEEAGKYLTVVMAYSYGSKYSSLEELRTMGFIFCLHLLLSKKGDSKSARSEFFHNNNLNTPLKTISFQL